MLSLTYGHVQYGYEGLSIHLNRNLQVTFLNSAANITEHNIRTLVQPVIVFRVFKGERKDPEIAKIGLVDACKALHDLGADPEIARRQRRMLPAGPLAVIISSDHNYDAFGSAFRGKPGIDLLEHMLAYRLDVRAKREHFISRRHDCVGRDVVSHLEHHLRFNHFGKGSKVRQGLDVGPSYHNGPHKFPCRENY